VHTVHLLLCQPLTLNLILQSKVSKGWEVQENSAKRFMRPKSSSNVGPRPRPKTIHLSEVDSSGASRPGHGKQTLHVFFTLI
jgi:hypothetical protein